MEKQAVHPETGPGHHDALSEARSFMERVFGFREFRPGQEEILHSVIEGSDALVIMPTGGGKSLCYQIPAFLRSGVSLVISPLIALMKDQSDTLRVLELPVEAIHSHLSLKEQEAALERIASGKAKLVYASPERLRSSQFMQALLRNRISMVAVDEAHCISQWGHDFRPDYLRIKRAVERMGAPQTLALTATATAKVRSDIIEQLRLNAPRVFVTGFDRRNLFWEVLRVRGGKDKLAVLAERLSGSRSGGSIVYTGTRKNVDRIAGGLRKSGIDAGAYHAGMDKEERSAVQEAFLTGSKHVVVATNAFGMGIDRPDIRMVIHHTFPGTLEAYYQESGRAGRDGAPATCLLLYSPEDRSLQEFFIEARYPSQGTVLSIYDRLRKRPEEILWLTYREIGEMGDEKISELAVGSCIKILEDAGAVLRLHRPEHMAELYLHQEASGLLSDLGPRAGVKRRLLERLGRIYGDEDLFEGIQFIPQELAESLDVSLDALRRALSDLDARKQATYIPPFRGRGLRLLKRMKPADLEIDFEALQVRKANDLANLDRVMAYASTDECRRRFLLRYFGETLREDHCLACDVCSARPGTEAPNDTARSDPVVAVKILSAVARLKGRFGQGTAVKVLRGSKDAAVLRFGLDRLSCYGLLNEYTRERVEKWIRELKARGCVVVRKKTLSGKPYPVLELTERGRDVMLGRDTVELALPETKKAPRGPRDAEASGGFREEIFEQLKALRTDLAKEENLPAYCIFHDRTLKEMARKRPKTRDELLDVVGVGEVTLRKYGESFLKVLQEDGGES